MSNRTFDNACTFIYRNARPLDIARWQYHFEGCSKEAVLTALAAYQNEDGGFGHALEPDAWNPNSAPIQTWTATEILREIDFTGAAHPIMQGILRYLASGQDFNGKLWYNEVVSSNDYPHAPWWHAEIDSSDSYNPTACLAGFIIRFADKDSDLYKLGCRIAKEAYDAYMGKSLLDDMHTAACYIRLMQYCEEAKIISVFDIDALKEKLRKQIKHSITQNTAEWETGYICKPSQFFNSCDSIFYTDNQEIADYECDFIERMQLDDGSWNIPWGWDGYPEEWAISKNWWKGNGAILNMLYLKGLGKLDIYDCCPVLQTERFTLRLVRESDAADLLDCYSDQQSQPIFDYENCTSDFRYSTIKEMTECIRFWLDEYAQKKYIRFAVIDKQTGKVIGTVEMFSNAALLADAFGGVLRIDLASRFETKEHLTELLKLANEHFYDLFGVEAIVTKGKPIAKIRIDTFLENGYSPYDWLSPDREYYYIRRK